MNPTLSILPSISVLPGAPVRPARIAIVGFGYWGKILSQNLADSGVVELAYIVEAHDEARAEAAETYPQTCAVADYAEALADPDLDLVVVATPTRSHYSLAREALLAGKHVFVEKPFTETLQQAYRLRSLASQVGRHLFVDHTFLFTGEVRSLKQIIDAGTIGEVVMIDACRMNFGKFQPEVNVTWDLAPHDLSIINYLIGCDPVTLHAEGSDSLGRGIEDTVGLTLKFPGKLTAYLHSSWISPRKERRMLISGTRGMIVYDDADPEAKIRLYDNQLVPRINDEGREAGFSYVVGEVTEVHAAEQRSALVEEFAYVSEVVAGVREHRINTADDAIWVLKILAQADRTLGQTAFAA